MSETVNELVNQLLSMSLKDVLKPVNEITKLIFGTSILTIYFKYFIAYPIVGFILVKIKSPKGTKGHIIGKILYFLVGYIAAFVLDHVSEIIFNID